MSFSRVTRQLINSDVLSIDVTIDKMVVSPAVNISLAHKQVGKCFFLFVDLEQTGHNQISGEGPFAVQYGSHVRPQR